MFTLMYLCTAYNLLPGCNPSWEAGHEYFLHIILYANAAILIDMHSQ